MKALRNIFNFLQVFLVTIHTKDISPVQFVDAFMLFSESLADIHKEGTVLSIDGKTIRNSGSDKALHIVSAWCEANQLVLGQKKVDSKSNEIKAIPELLDLR